MATIENKLPLPVTPSPIGNNALPLPTTGNGRAAAAYVPAAGDDERRCVAIWERVFDRRPIGVEDSFDQLGGDSLLAVEIFIQIEAEFGERLAFDVLLEAPTIRGVARLLGDRTKAAEKSPLLATLRAEGTAPPLFFVPGIGGILMGFQPLVESLGPNQPAYGLRPRGCDGREEPQRDMRQWAADNIAILRSVQPAGPYRLVGHSLGGVLAFEMARQLEAEGERIELLALIDSQLWSEMKRLPLLQRLWMHVWKFWNKDEGGRRQYFAIRWRLLKARLRRRSLRHQPEDAVLGLNCPAPVRDMSMIHFAALREYRPGVYRGQVVLFTASAEWGPTGHALTDPTLGWAPWVDGPVEVHDIPTTHTQILGRPHAETLARTIEAHIGRTLAMR